jgi:ankyrin repeat protein
MENALSFKNAVNHAFSEALEVRTWSLLVARKYDQDPGRLSIPRQISEDLEHHFEHHKYNKEFLQQMCAMDADNNYLDLYIALSHDNLSWTEIRNLTPYGPALENDPNIESCWQYDPILDEQDEDLLDACHWGALEVVKQKLKDTPQDLNARYALLNTPLHITSRKGHAEIVKLLLEKGCDVNAVNSAGDTPLYDAIENGHVEIVHMLIENGASCF